MAEAIADILDFWFGPLDGTGFPLANRSRLWWGGGAELDEQISQRFGQLVEKALDGGLTGWADTARGRLALILLLWLAGFWTGRSLIVRQVRRRFQGVKVW